MALSQDLCQSQIPGVNLINELNVWLGKVILQRKKNSK